MSLPPTLDPAPLDQGQAFKCRKRYGCPYPDCATDLLAVSYDVASVYTTHSCSSGGRVDETEEIVE
jgi:hypothetical protein